MPSAPPPSPSARPTTGGTARRLVLGATGALLVALAVLPALPGPLVLDDLPALEFARQVAGPAGWGEAWRPGTDPGETLRGRPLAAWSFALQVAAGLSSPAALRLGNLFLHGAAAWLLAGVVQRTLVRLRFGPGPAATAAAWTGLLWLVHPLALTAVVYVVQRAEVLAGLGMLGALAAFARGVDGPRPGPWLALSAAASLAALLAKESAAGLPLLVALYDRCFVAGSWRGAWRARAGYYLALAAGWIPLGLLVAAGAGRGGTAGWDSTIGTGAYLVTQGEAVAGYLGHVLWPHPLTFDHGPVVATLPGALAPGLLVLVLLAASGWGVWRGHPFGFAGGAFFLCLAPSSSLVPVASQTIAEHRMYVALAAPLALLAALLVRRAPKQGWMVAGGALLALTAAAAVRHGSYRDEVTLWTETVARRPDNPRAHHNLGQAEFTRGNFAVAAEHFRQAERRRPGDPDTRHNLALCALRLGRAEEARAMLEENLRRAPAHQPTALALGEVRGELGRQALAAGRAAEAREHFTAAAALRPQDPRPRHNLGNVLLELDAVEAALAAWREALAADATFGESRRALAFVLLRTGRAAEALPHLERLAREEPGRADIRAALTETRQAVGR